LLNSNISSTYPHNIVNFGPLTAEIGSGVWGILANFNGFRVLASLLQRRCSTEVKQTLHDVRSSPWMVHCMYIFGGGGTCFLTEFCHVQNSLCVQVLRSPILTALLYGTRAVGISKTLRRGIFTRQGDHLDNGSQPFLNSSARNLHTSLVYGKG